MATTIVSEKTANTITRVSSAESAAKATGIFTSSSTDELERLVRANGLYRPSTDEWFNKFSRFQTLNPWRRLNYTKEYLFFTKPDLRIFYQPNDTFLHEEIKNGIDVGDRAKQTSGSINSSLHYNNTYPVPFFREMEANYKIILKQLQYSEDRTTPFMNLLSNAKRSNLELSDVQASGDIDSPANIFGTKIYYRGTSYSSDDGYDFTIDFEDSKYLEVYRFLKAYDLYENRKHMGLVSLPDEYVRNKVLHDQFSIYKFIVDEDFSTLVYWAKLTGCYIKSVPRTSFSDLSETGGLLYTVSFRCSFIEDMTPEILSDFNRVSSTITGTTDSPLYDQDLGTSNPDWCDRPYIQYNDIDNSKKYYDAKTYSDNTFFRPRLLWQTKSMDKSKQINTQLATSNL